MHELLDLVIVEPLVLELATVHTAHARPVQVLAGELRKVVREAAVNPSMTVVRESKFAQLVFLLVALGHELLLLAKIPLGASPWWHSLEAFVLLLLLGCPWLALLKEL